MIHEECICSDGAAMVKQPYAEASQTHVPYVMCQECLTVDVSSSTDAQFHSSEYEPWHFANGASWERFESAEHASDFSDETCIAALKCPIDSGEHGLYENRSVDSVAVSSLQVRDSQMPTWVKCHQVQNTKCTQSATILTTQNDAFPSHKSSSSGVGLEVFSISQDSKHPKDVHVSFSEVVEVCCFQNEKKIATKIDGRDIAKCCRSLWHLHGQVTSFAHFPTVLSRFAITPPHVSDDAMNIRGEDKGISSSQSTLPGGDGNRLARDRTSCSNLLARSLDGGAGFQTHFH